MAVGVPAPLGEGHSGETSGGVKVFIDVEGIKSGIKSPESGLKAEAALHLGQQRKEVGDIGLVKGLGQFGQDNLAPVRHFGGDQTRGIAPVVLSDRNCISRAGIAGGGGGRFFGRRPLIVPPFTAQAAVGVASRLFGFVVTLAFEVSLGVILL